MKVIEIINDFEIGLGNSENSQNLSMVKDTFYVMSDILYQKLSNLVPLFLGAEIPFYEVCNKYDKSDLSNKKIIMLRHGGGGDILFMKTVANYMKKVYPSITINFAIGGQYFSLVKHSYSVSEVYSLPIPLSIWQDHHFHFTFEGLIEHNYRAKFLNAYDLFFEESGFDPFNIEHEDKIPTIEISDKEKSWLEETLPIVNNPIKKIGIQYKTSSPIRTFPPYKWIEVAKSLIEKGYAVFFFGSGAEHSDIENIVKQIGSGSFNVANSGLRENIILAERMDCFIAPDSMFAHIAGALRIPLIGIYGPFHSSTRIKYFKNAVGIDLKTGCSPCFRHGHHPCPKGNPSPCFSLIAPEVIVETFEKTIEKNIFKKEN
jgi:ADP-heptose:LPS heptosyltransferase